MNVKSHLNAYYIDIIAVVGCVLFSLFIVSMPISQVAVGLFIIVTGGLVIISPLAGISLLLILSPMRALINTEAPSLLPIDIGQLLFGLFVALWIFHHIYRAKRNAYRHNLSLMFPLLLFIAVITLTVFVANNLSAWLMEWIKWLIIATVVFYVLENRRHRKIIIYLLVISAFGHAIIGIYTFLGGSGADHLKITGRFFRAFGTFGQPNPFGGFMGLVAPIAIMLTYSQLIACLKKPSSATFLKLSILASIAGVIIVALFASWSRGAWLGFGASVGMLLVVLPRKKWQSLLVFIMGVIFVIGVASANILPSSITNRLQSITQEMLSSADVQGVYITSDNYAVIERLAHWQAAINMAEANPFLGVGMGNYDSAYNDYRLLNWEMSLRHAHNYYLNILAETGAVGLTLYLLLFTAILVMVWKATTHPDYTSRHMAIGLLGAWVYLIIHSLTDNLYVNNIFIHIGVMIGITLCLYDEVIGTMKDR